MVLAPPPFATYVSPNLSLSANILKTNVVYVTNTPKNLPGRSLTKIFDPWIREGVVIQMNRIFFMTKIS